MRETDRLQPLQLLAGLKIVVAISVLLAALLTPEQLSAAPGQWSGVKAALLLVQIAALSAAGALLVIGGRHDRRAVYLGVVCLLIAAALAPNDTFLLHLELEHPWGALLFALVNLRIEVFLAPLLGLFVRDFPAMQLSFRLRRRVDRFITLCWLAASVLLLGHLIWLRRTLAADATRSSGLADPFYLPSILTVVALALVAVAFLGWKARRSAGDEGRRGRVFLLTIVGGSVFGITALIAMLPWSVGIQIDPTTRLIALLAMNAILVAIPFAIAYAVLVERILDVRGIARKAVEHTLTRSTARLLIAAPFGFLAVYLYQYRHVPLVELFSVHHLLLLLVALLGFLGLSYRRQLLDTIDQHFFPEEYNARRLLSQLPDQIRDARNFEELANLIGRGLRLAWQLERAGLLVSNADSGVMLDLRNELSPLDIDSELLADLAKQRRPLEVDLGSESSPLRRLPESERHWLVDGRVRLLVPTFATDGTLNAVIALGMKNATGKKNAEQLFLNEDLRRMDAISSSTGLLVEILELKGRKNHEEEDGVRRMFAPTYVGELSEEILSSDNKAAECLSCGSVYPAGTPTCGKCKLELGEALVPYALRRMFRFEERIGIGGMAVVYRATDLKLGRSVAIKTLPRVSPEAAMRLQQEARTAATVSHPGLAAIYGIETWAGTPMLILEYLEGGTLSGRLMRGPLSVFEVIETGQIVAQALEVIHTHGILHRDIKPSNIGYTSHGDAKLLDFGIARIYQDLRRDNEDPSEILTVDGRMMQQADNITGTLCYFSPEALDDATPDPTFDLWSLTVVLYEALTARNLFYRPRLKVMLEAIREAEVPDPRQEIPDCPNELVDFFRTELNPEKVRRSQNGREFHQRLERVRSVLGSPPPGSPSHPPSPILDIAS